MRFPFCLLSSFFPLVLQVTVEAVSHTEGSGLRTCPWLDGGVVVEMGKRPKCEDGCRRKKSPTCLSILLISTLGNELMVLGCTY